MTIHPDPHRPTGPRASPDSAAGPSTSRATRATTPPASLEVAVDQRPAAVPSAPPRATSRSSSAAAAAGLRVAPQGTGHNAGPLSAAASTTSSWCAPCDGRRHRRPGRASPGSRPARCGSTPWRPRPTRPGRAARLLPRRRRRRLLPRRRHRLVRPRARPGHQQPHRRRARHRRRQLVRADADRTPSCSGRCAAAAATSASSPRWSSGCTRSRRRTPACSSGTAPTPSRCCGVGRVGAGRARRGDDVVPGAQLPPFPEIPEPSAAASSPSSTARCSERRARPRAPRAAARLGPEIDTFARVPAAALTRLHMDPEGPTPAVSDAAMLGALPDAAVDAFLEQVGRARRPPSSRPSCASSAAPSAGRTVGGGALWPLDAAYAQFGVAIAASPEDGVHRGTSTR